MAPYFHRKQRIVAGLSSDFWAKPPPTLASLTKEARSLVLRSNSLIMPLCDFCVAINAFQLCKPGGQLHSSIRHIKVSAKTCEFCALLLKECDSVGDGETTRLVGKSSREVKQDNPEAFDRCVLWGIDVYPADSNVPYLGRQEQLGRNVLVEKPSDAPVGHVRLHALEGGCLLRRNVVDHTLTNVIVTRHCCCYVWGHSWTAGRVCRRYRAHHEMV